MPIGVYQHKPHSDQTKIRMSISAKGKKKPIRTTEHRRNLGLALKGKISWMKGKKHSLESLVKMSIAKIKKNFSLYLFEL